MDGKDTPVRLALRCAALLREGWHDQDALAARLGVTPRAVRRYLAAIAEEEEGFSVRSSNEFGRREYAIRRQRALSEPRRERYGVLALSIARRFFAAFDPGGVADLLDQLLFEQTGEEDADAGELRRRFVLARAPQPLPGDVRHAFDRVLEALLESRVVDLRYRPRHGEPRDYVLRPFTLVLGDDELAVIGAVGDVGIEGPRRTFALHRIERLQLRSERFDYPSRQAWSPEAHFAGSWGMWAGPAEPITIAIHPGFEGLVAERRWHPSQRRLDAADDGWVRLEFLAFPGGELQSWLLGWGPWIRIEGPDELALRVARLRSAPPGTVPPSPDDLFRIA